MYYLELQLCTSIKVIWRNFRINVTNSLALHILIKLDVCINFYSLSNWNEFFYFMSYAHFYVLLKCIYDIAKKIYSYLRAKGLVNLYTINELLYIYTYGISLNVILKSSFIFLSFSYES